MTTDTPGFFGAPIGAMQTPLEEATASSNLQHAEGTPTAPQLRLVETGWQDNSSTYYDVLDALTRSVPNAAAHKNVPVQPQFHTDIAREAIRRMTDEEMAGLLALDPAGIKSAQVALSHTLDVLAATMIANFIAYIRGVENPAPCFITPIVDAHIKEIEREGTVVVWPDLLEAAQKYAHLAEAVDA